MWVWRRSTTWPPGHVRLAISWVASRLLMLALLNAHVWTFGVEVSKLYQGWSDQLRTGSFPVGDPLWQYPPAAAFVFLAPYLVPAMSYLHAFVVLTLVADATVMAALLRCSARPGRSVAGAFVWMVALPLMFSLPLVRYDVVVTAIAVLGLLALPGRPRLGGALAGLALMVKAWPLLIVLGTPRGRSSRQAWIAMSATAAALTLFFLTAFRGTFSFLTQQKNRGIEIESLGGTVLHLARLFGWAGTVHYRYGSEEFFGPYVSTIATISMVLTGLAFGWLMMWRARNARWTPATCYDGALTAVLLFVLTSRVLSPQYMIWLAGLAAVCLTVEHTVQRPVAALILLATAVTTLDYPLYFSDVMANTDLGIAIIVLRNALLTAATALSCVRLWRGSGAGPKGVPTAPAIDAAPPAARPPQGGVPAGAAEERP